MTGYQAAVEDGMKIVVKIDGDGQMDPRYIADFAEPVSTGETDYTKGNRFFNLDSLEQMPKTRLLGNPYNNRHHTCIERITAFLSLKLNAASTL